MLKNFVYTTRINFYFRFLRIPSSKFIREKKRLLKEIYNHTGDKFLSIYRHLEHGSKNSDLGTGELQPLSTLLPSGQSSYCIEYYNSSENQKFSERVNCTPWPSRARLSILIMVVAAFSLSSVS